MNMYRCALASTIVAVLFLLAGRDSSASVILPDVEFSFAASVLDAREATRLVEAALAPLGFESDPQSRVRDDGFFQAEFTDSTGRRVSLSGLVSCTQVHIYTSQASKTEEAAELEAAEIHEHLLTALRATDSNLLLFKSGGSSGRDLCAKTL